MKYQQNAAAAAARQSTAALDPAGISRDSRRATAEEGDRDRSAYQRQESARRRYACPAAALSRLWGMPDACLPAQWTSLLALLQNHKSSMANSACPHRLV